MTDLVYMKVGASDSGARARSVHPRVGGTLAASMSVQFEMFIAEAALAYELFHWNSRNGWRANIDRSLWRWTFLVAERGDKPGVIRWPQHWRSDGQWGARLADSGDVTWFDPLVGLRLRHHFSPHTELVLRGDVGGFGAGSKFSWQAMGYLNWDFARTQSAIWSGMLGYRALYVDFEKGAGSTLYQYDVLTHGPVIGVTARF